MKLKRVKIENFKGIKELSFSLDAPAGPRPLTAIIGDNASGKTTVLQAIALTLSLATRRTYSPERLRWYGVLPERIPALGAARVELDVALESEEVERTTEAYQRWYDSRPEWITDDVKIIEPSQLSSLTLVYQNGQVSSPQGRAAVYQLRGRWYIRELRKLDRGWDEIFPLIGDVFWFDQYRNLGSIRADEERQRGAWRREEVSDFDDSIWKAEDRAEDGQGWHAGVELLREHLVGWWAFHTSPTLGGSDYLEIVARLLDRVFPGTQFMGVEPRGSGRLGARDFYVFLQRGGRTYDIAEMSSGEQAVFAIAYELTRLRVARSVVLIDELELHLHPPEQQALLGALRHFGNDCQYIITTHSSYLERAIPDEHEVRLKGGRLCL
jgi:ABC-type transport system involved in cytochrome c biogenesis ATPase subunit